MGFSSGKVHDGILWYLLLLSTIFLGVNDVLNDGLDTAVGCLLELEVGEVCCVFCTLGRAKTHKVNLDRSKNSRDLREISQYYLEFLELSGPIFVQMCVTAFGGGEGVLAFGSGTAVFRWGGMTRNGALRSG